MINEKFSNLFGCPVRKEDSKAEQIHYDIGASAQLVLEETLLKMTNHVYEKTKKKNLCLGGGVALNGVANYRILKEDETRDLPVFGNKYWYGYGATYYLNVYFRF